MRHYDVSDALNLSELVMEKCVLFEETFMFCDDDMRIIGLASLNEPIAKVKILSHDLIIHLFVLFLLLVHPHSQPFQTLIRIFLLLLAEP